MQYYLDKPSRKEKIRPRQESHGRFSLKKRVPCKGADLIKSKSNKKRIKRKRKRGLKISADIGEVLLPEVIKVVKPLRKEIVKDVLV